jgi:Protein of unknown function (DUF2721)
MSEQISSPPNAPQPTPDLHSLKSELASIRRRLSWLTTAVFLVAFALLLVVATVFGYLVDFHAGESKLVAGACTAGTAMGFLFGWLARRAG